MSLKDVNELLKILKQHKKTDLITKVRIAFEDILDEDYIPPKSIRRNRYSDSEGSAEEESVYCTEDEEGFLSLA
jgi:hypothetical protein